MAEPEVSGASLQTLLEITSSLSGNSEPECLEEAIARVSALVPYEKCTLMHERAAQGQPNTLIYEFPGSHVPGRVEPRCEAAAVVARQTMTLQRVESFQNAFFWRARIRPHGAVQGIAGLASSDEGPNYRSATLLQFQYPREISSPEQLPLVNIIVFYVHIHLVYCARSLVTSAAKYPLTSREAEVLRWIVGGKTSWEVGRILSMSERTVKFHLHNIYAKLNVVNRAQAVIAAARLRLV